MFEDVTLLLFSSWYSPAAWVWGSLQDRSPALSDTRWRGSTAVHVPAAVPLLQAVLVQGSHANHDREVVESPSLEIFKTRLDKVLCSLLYVTLLRQGGWTRWPTEVPSNPYYSVILWFCDSQPFPGHLPGLFRNSFLNSKPNWDISKKLHSTKHHKNQNKDSSIAPHIDTLLHTQGCARAPTCPSCSGSGTSALLRIAGHRSLSASSHKIGPPSPWLSQKPSFLLLA